MSAASLLKRCVWVLLIMIIGGGLGWWAFQPRDEVQAELPLGVTAEQYERARSAFAERFRREPGELDILSLLAEQRYDEGELDAAVNCLQLIPISDPRYGITSVIRRTEILRELNRAEDAEKAYRQLLELAESTNAISIERVVQVRNWLTYLLSVQLRFEERREMLLQAHETGYVDVYDSKQLFFPHLLIWSGSRGRQRLEEYLEADPRNGWFKIALARYRTAEGRLDDARRLLADVPADRDIDLHRQAARLEVEFEADQWDAFQLILGELDEFEEGEPWLLTRMRGQWALHQRDWSTAGKMFREVQRNDPAEPSAQMGIARVLSELGLEAQAEQARQRSLLLAEIRVALPKVNDRDPEASRALASQCEQIDMPEAARFFRLHAVQIEGSVPGQRPEEVIPE